MDLPLERLGGPQGSVQVRWQGCAEAGLCYSPAQAVVRLHVGEGPGTPGTALVELPPDDAAAPPAAEKQEAAKAPPAPASIQADTSAIGQAGSRTQATRRPASPSSRPIASPGLRATRSF